MFNSATLNSNEFPASGGHFQAYKLAGLGQATLCRDLSASFVNNDTKTCLKWYIIYRPSKT